MTKVCIRACEPFESLIGQMNNCIRRDRIKSTERNQDSMGFGREVIIPGYIRFMLVQKRGMKLQKCHSLIDHFVKPCHLACGIKVKFAIPCASTEKCRVRRGGK